MRIIIILYLILVAIVVFLLLLEKRKKKKRKKVLEREWNNIVQPRSNNDITRDFFNMKLNNFLKKKYLTLVKWEYACGNKGVMHHLSNVITVKVTLIGNITFVEDIVTADVWNYNTNNTPVTTPTATPKKKPVASKEKVFTSVEDYILKNGRNIEKTIQKAKAKGIGFYAYYEVSKELASDSFMKELAEKYENQGYECSYKNNILEIGFQDLLVS